MAARNSRVQFCSGNDIVTESQNLILSRGVVLESWAAIEAKKSSSFSRNGSSLDKESIRTHCITITTRRNIDFTNAAWIYQERKQSSPRWFKIIGQTECGDQTEFDCRLVERGDHITKPAENNETHGVISNVVARLPDGVVL